MTKEVMNYKNTYCNPLPLPDYPQGCHAHDRQESGWLNSNVKKDFRELADPSVLYDNNRWILYPSVDMAWVTEDFRNWTHVKMNISDIGYAPTIFKHHNVYYLTASAAPLYSSSSPLGSWKMVGEMIDMDGKPLPYYWDPMIFADDDGRCYCYWGCGGPGIFGAELDPEQPFRAITKPELLMSYQPSHIWERAGEFNEDSFRTYVEGPWLFKYGKRYYLTYCAPGTEYGSYAMGCYVADHPLGPFNYQTRNPILKTTQGFVRGPGHGCIVAGPNNTLWAFYTCVACRDHMLERRVGCDPAGFDADGNFFVNGASQMPQWVPGVLEHPERGNAAELLPVSVSKFAVASSQLPARGASCAIDNCIRTWWEAVPDDVQPTLELDLKSVFDVAAMRLVWAEPNLNFQLAPPGPFQYILEVREKEQSPWIKVINAMDNQIDLLIDYRTFPVIPAQYVKLTVTGAPAGVGIGVTDLCIFGQGRLPGIDAPYGKWPVSQ